MKVRMMGGLVLGFLLAALLVGAQEPAVEGPMTENEFVTLVNAKTPVDEIIAQIRARGVAFTLRPELEEPLKKIKGGEELLKAIIEPATVELHVNVPGAAVKVGGQERGQTSAEGKLVVPGLAPRSQLIQVEATGYVGERVEVFLKPAETRRLEMELVPAVESTPGPLGHRVKVQAGTAEDNVLVELEFVREPGARVGKLNDLIQRYDTSPLALLLYGLLQQTHLEAEQFGDSINAGEELLRRDDRNFAAHIRLARAQRGRGELEAAFDHTARARQLAEEVKAAGPPEGIPGDTWPSEKGKMLQESENDLKSLAYDLFVSASALSPPARKTAVMERYLEVFPQSDYRPQAYVNLALAYQQQGNMDKMLEWADRALEANPNQPVMLVLVAGALSDSGQELDRARQLAARLLDLLGSQAESVRPQGLTDEQWAQQQQLWEGLARSALGYVSWHQGNAPAGIEEFRAALPLLKNQTLLYARNLWGLGNLLASLGGRENMEEAQRVLGELVELGTPYAPPAQELLEKVNQALAKKRKP